MKLSFLIITFSGWDFDWKQVGGRWRDLTAGACKSETGPVLSVCLFWTQPFPDILWLWMSANAPALTQRLSLSLVPEKMERKEMKCWEKWSSSKSLQQSGNEWRDECGKQAYYNFESDCERSCWGAQSDTTWKKQETRRQPGKPTAHTTKHR